MMLTCKTTLVCAFALISSVSAGLIPAIALPVDPLAQTSVPGVLALVSGTGDSGSCPPGFVPAAPGSSTLLTNPAGLGSGIASAITGGIASATVIKDAAAIVGNVVATVGSSASDVISVLTDSFPGFTNSLVLSCIYGDIIVSPASNGIEVPVAQAASAPSCFTSPSFSGNHVLIMIGPGADNTQTLHFVQPGEVSSSDSIVSSLSSVILPVAFSSPETPAVKYLGPISSGLDKYTLVLFKQPADFELSNFHDSDRYGFDLTTFADKHALGAPVAGIFFVCGNHNGNGTHSGIGKLHGTNSTNATNFTNGTLHGSYNGTNNSTTHSGNFHGNNNSSSDGSATPSTSSGGNIPVSPNAVINTPSFSKASAYAANFALAGFIAAISVGVLLL